MARSIEQRLDEMRRTLRRRIGELPAREVRRSFAYDRGRLVNPVLAEREAGATDLETAVAATGLSIGYPGWNLLYYALLCSLPEGRCVVVETGTNEGYSTIVLAQALADGGQGGIVHTIDLDPRLTGIARTNLERAGLAGHVELHTGDSLELLARIAAAEPRIDFAFLDSDHERAHVLAELERVHPAIVRAGGKVYFDNASAGGVAEALDAVQARYGGNLIRFANCSWGPPGAAIWQPAPGGGA